METFSALLAICAGNSPVPGEFPAQRLVTRSFDVFFDLHPNKRFSKQSYGWWFETPSRSLWRHCNEYHMDTVALRWCGICRVKVYQKKLESHQIISQSYYSRLYEWKNNNGVSENISQSIQYVIKIVESKCTLIISYRYVTVKQTISFHITTHIPINSRCEADERYTTSEKI